MHLSPRIGRQLRTPACRRGRSFQAENGFLETSNQEQNVLDSPESLVRFGVAKRTEVRFTVPDYFHNLNPGGGLGSGFGDFAFGVKEQLGPTPGGFDVSVILFLSFPTGANTVSSGGYDPGLQIPWSRALSANWTTAGMLSVYWPTQGPTRNVTGDSRIPRVACSTTPKDPKNLLLIVDESRVRRSRLKRSRQRWRHPGDYFPPSPSRLPA